MDTEKETLTNREIEWAYYKLGRSGSFATALCRAWELADFENKSRLEVAYPLLFGAANLYMLSEDPDEFIQELLLKKRK